MAHPKRRKQAEALFVQLLKYDFEKVGIVWDQINDEWHTGDRALRFGVNKGDWHVVIQDDAILTPDFYTNIQGCVNSVPTKTLISLYTGTARPLADRVKLAVDKSQDGGWLNFYMLLWGVGILLPSNQIEPMLDFVNEPRYADTLYDQKVGIFYQRNMLPIYYTVPSLVNHDDDLGSLLNHGQTPEPRVAHRLATGVITWTNRVIDL